MAKRLQNRLSDKKRFSHNAITIRYSPQGGQSVMLVTMRELLSEATDYGVAAFNIIDFSSTKAAVEAAEELNSPLIIQVSPKTVRFWGADDVAGWVRLCADCSKTPVVLHLDHCYDFDFIKMCIDAGWTSVMYDGSEQPFEQNLLQTKKAAEMAHSRGVSLEGEVGAIGGVEDDKFVNEEDACLADPEQVIQLAQECDLDVVAAACGTAHGMYKKTPNVRFDLLQSISSRIDTPLALHGGTGLSEATFKKCIELNCRKINVSTQLKITGIEADYNYIHEHPKEYNPLKVFENRLQAYKEMMTGFLQTFGSVGKAA